MHLSTRVPLQVIYIYTITTCTGTQDFTFQINTHLTPRAARVVTCASWYGIAGSPFYLLHFRDATAPCAKSVFRRVLNTRNTLTSPFIKASCGMETKINSYQTSSPLRCTGRGPKAILWSWRQCRDILDAAALFVGRVNHRHCTMRGTLSMRFSKERARTTNSKAAMPPAQGRSPAEALQPLPLHV